MYYEMTRSAAIYSKRTFLKGRLVRIGAGYYVLRYYRRDITIESNER